MTYTIGADRNAPKTGRQQFLQSLFMDQAPKRLMLTFDEGRVSEVFFPVDSD